MTDGAVTKYYSIAGMTVAMYSDNSMKYLLTDQLGSVVAVTNASGALLSQQRYLPFGQVRTDVGTVSETDFGYTGQRALGDLGLMDYHARMYDAVLGRFVQPDTIIPNATDPQSLNRYSYALGNPIRYNDPDGHCIFDPIEFVACVAAAVIYLSGGSNVTSEVLTANAHQKLIADKYTKLSSDNQITDLEKGAKLVDYAAKLDPGCTSCFVQNVGAVLSGGAGIIQPPVFDLTKAKSLASPYYQQGIGQSGFSLIYQDPSTDSGGGNQLHHYWYYVQVGYETNKDWGDLADWIHENVIGNPAGMSTQDLLLGYQGVDTGIALRNNILKPSDVRQHMIKTLTPQRIIQWR